MESNKVSQTRVKRTEVIWNSFIGLQRVRRKLERLKSDIHEEPTEKSDAPDAPAPSLATLISNLPTYIIEEYEQIEKTIESIRDTIL